MADPVLVDIVDELTAKHGVSPSVLGIDIREPSAAALGTSEANLRALEERDVWWRSTISGPARRTWR